MKTAIGFNLGQRGDIIMNTVAARAFKETAPGYHLTLGVGPQFADMEPFFKNHPHIDAFHVYSSYDGWPNQSDKDYLIAQGYSTVFNGMPQHTHRQWWTYYHQAQETCWMHGLNVPSDGLQCRLTQWFDIDDRRDTVAFAPFAGWYNPSNDKRLSVERAQEICDLIVARGYKVLQIGGADEPRLTGAIFAATSYFESIRAILGCALFVHTDTGAGWAVSAYGFPQLGLYSHAYYGPEYVKHIQPVNPLGVFLSEASVNQINLDKIAHSLDHLLS